MGTHSTLVDGMTAVGRDEAPATGSGGVGGVTTPGASRDDDAERTSTDSRSPEAPSPGSGGTPDAPALTLRAIIRRFWPYTRTDRLKLVLAFLAMAAATACDTVVVTMFARIVDGATVSHSMDAVWPSAIEWLALTAFGGVLSVTGGFLLVGAAERFVFRLRHDVFAHLQRLGPGFLGAHPTGDLMSRLTTDVDGVEALASSGIVTTIIAVGTAIAYAAAAVLVQWQLAVIVVALAPLMWLTSRITGRFTKTAARVERRAAGEVGTAVEQALSNLPLIQAYGTETTESARLDRHSETWWRARARESRLQMIYSPITTIIQSGALLAVLIAGAAFIATGELTVGGLFGFAAYLGYLYPPLSQLGSLHLMVTSASASCERLVEILDTGPEVSDTPDAEDSVVARGHVELRATRYVYPGTEDAGLDGVSLEVQPGQFVLVTGPSGAGKSTLTRMLLRFVDAQDGAVLLDGVDVRDRTIAAVRQAVTLLPQEPMLFDLTVGENIAYARPDATRDEIERAAGEAGALGFVRDLPQGFDTPVGEGGGALSGGQRQRIAIARALLRTSPVLVLDEPTTGLDGPTARAVLEPLRRLAGGRTTIVVSHDLTPARDADLVVVLDGGRVVARGRHHELLAAGGIYGELWAAQHGARGSSVVAHEEEDAPTAAVDRRPALPAPRPARPARLTAAGLAALDPGAARGGEPVTAPLRLLARSSTTTGPTPIRPRPAPPSRAAAGPFRPVPAAAPRSRHSAPVAAVPSAAVPGPSAAVPGPSAASHPAAAPDPSAAVPGPSGRSRPATAPGPSSKAGRPGPSATSRGSSGASSGTAPAAPTETSRPLRAPSTPARPLRPSAPAVSPREVPAPRAARSERHAARDVPAAAHARASSARGLPTTPATVRPGPVSPPRSVPPTPAAAAASSRSVEPPSPVSAAASARPSSTPRPTPPPPPHAAPTVPPPRDPMSGPIPASRRADPDITGRPTRRTVADLVAGTNLGPVGAAPRAATGSHRAEDHP